MELCLSEKAEVEVGGGLAWIDFTNIYILCKWEALEAVGGKAFLRRFSRQSNKS